MENALRPAASFPFNPFTAINEMLVRALKKKRRKWLVYFDFSFLFTLQKSFVFGKNKNRLLRMESGNKLENENGKAKKDFPTQLNQIQPHRNKLILEVCITA